jgi:cytochrome c oxidase accessory protein FixG
VTQVPPPPRQDTQAEASFRDRLGIVSREGKRRWVYSKKPSGAFHRGRIVASTLLMAIFLGVPFIQISGHPLMLFNVPEAKFIVLGMILGPHDFFLLALGMITAIVFIFLFTAVFGRLFCGWVCPQTVLMEMVFRKIDYLIEGGPVEQRRLNESPWSLRKFRIKVLKHGVYFALSFLIANLMLAWVIGIQSLQALVTAPPSQHPGELAAIVIAAGAFHWVFGWFREQACILVCPYGRLQGVLLDRNSVVIAYDTTRGEPRGKLKKGEERQQGDCIDCIQCVEVCPTGIDIRNGTQLECVNCTACIDACDAVMTAVRRPKGLIRYDSAEGIERKKRSLATPRSIAYSVVLAGLLVLVTYLFLTRSDIDVTILRTPGMFYQEQPDGYISNLYDVKAVNKTFQEAGLSFRVKNLAGGMITVLGDSVVVKGQGSTSAHLFVLLKRDRITSFNTPLEIEVYHGQGMAATARVSFLGPAGKKNE